jgi:hypothetical protein
LLLFVASDEGNVFRLCRDRFRFVRLIDRERFHQTAPFFMNKVKDALCEKLKLSNSERFQLQTLAGR